MEVPQRPWNYIGMKSTVPILAAPYLFNRTPDAPLLSVADAKIFHTHVATALYLANRTSPLICPAIGELCGCVKAPTIEDDKKLDMVISFLKTARDDPLRLGCTMPPRVTASIDAAFANRQNMRSTTGMCVTFGIGFFIMCCKMQKLNSKPSTEAEFIAVSDGMNLGLWLAGWLASLDTKDVRDSPCALKRTTNHALRC
jgi:hypothetical protein